VADSVAAAPLATSRTSMHVPNSPSVPQDRQPVQPRSLLARRLEIRTRSSWLNDQGLLIKTGNRRRLESLVQGSRRMVAARPIGQNSHRQLRRAAPCVAPRKASRAVIHKRALDGTTDEHGAMSSLVSERAF
jgi:hypothetical protein